MNSKGIVIKPKRIDVMGALYETDWRDAPSTRDLHGPATEIEVARIPLDSFGRIRFEIVEFRNIRFCHTPLATFTPN